MLQEEAEVTLQLASLALAHEVVQTWNNLHALSTQVEIIPGYGFKTEGRGGQTTR